MVTACPARMSSIAAAQPAMEPPTIATFMASFVVLDGAHVLARSRGAKHVPIACHRQTTGGGRDRYRRRCRDGGHWRIEFAGALSRVEAEGW
jgi:hypothetical protein